MPRHDNDQDDNQHEFSAPSKTRVKQALLDLQSLGTELAELSETQLKSLNIGDRLLDALLEYKRLNAHGALKRQSQFIGKLLRDEDAEQLRQVLERRRHGKVQDARAFQDLERWRERLIAEEGALEEWLALHPGSSAKGLRALVQNARRERQQSGIGHGASVHHFRELFKRLREDRSVVNKAGG